MERVNMGISTAAVLSDRVLVLGAPHLWITAWPVSAAEGQSFSSKNFQMDHVIQEAFPDRPYRS